MTDLGDFIAGTGKTQTDDRVQLSERGPGIPYLFFSAEDFTLFDRQIRAYGNNGGHSFILGHPVNGVLGSGALGVNGSQILLGDHRGGSYILRVENPGSTYKEWFVWDDVIDISNTNASYTLGSDTGSTGEIVF